MAQKEEKSPAMGPTFAVIGVPAAGSVERTGIVYVLPWTDAEGQRCPTAARLLSMVQDMGPLETRSMLQQEWAEQQQLPLVPSGMTIAELVAADSVSLFDGTHEVSVQHLEGYAPQRSYLSPGWHRDLRAQSYELKNSILDSVFLYGPVVNHIVLVRSRT